MMKLTQEGERLVKEWLQDYKPHTQDMFARRLNKFLEWSNKSPEQLLKFSAKELRHMVIQFIREKEEEGVSSNSILAYYRATRLFFEEYEKPIKLKRSQIPEAKSAEGYHEFSNGDLKSIIELANLQYKALFATLASTGFAIGDVLALDKTTIKYKIESESEFVFFEIARGKTNAKTLVIINPLAKHWLRKWIKQNPEPTLFNVNADTVGIMLNNLAEKCGIKEKCRTHEFRKWVMTSLTKAGFNEFEVKFCVGKKIPLSDATYLRLRAGIEEKYPKVYDRYLNIVYQEGEGKEATIKLAEMRSELLDIILRQKTRIDNLEKQLQQAYKAWGADSRGKEGKIYTLEDMLDQTERREEQREMEKEERKSLTPEEKQKRAESVRKKLEELRQMKG